MFQVNPLKNQALFSLKDKSEKLKWPLLQFLFGALRVNSFYGNIFLHVIKRHCNRVTRVARLWSRKSPEGREFKAGLCHCMTGKLSLVNSICSKWVPFTNQGRIRQ